MKKVAITFQCHALNVIDRNLFSKLRRNTTAFLKAKIDNGSQRRDSISSSANKIHGLEKQSQKKTAAINEDLKIYFPQAIVNCGNIAGVDFTVG